MSLKSRQVFLFTAAVTALFPALGGAATLCVKPGGASGCFAHINDAIAKAKPADTVHVFAGVYPESVLIVKSLSLTGDSGAVIDAANLSNGIFVNGLNLPFLSRITISGFTVQNAQYEGILLANASSVTVTSNQVLNNNQALTPAGCPGLPVFETNEQMDCGEGIHLLGVNHSIVSNNVSQGNSGGILLADDTGATYNNLIIGNTVQDNPYACGITMASHPPAALTHAKAPYGVHHNTVYGNRSGRNGLSNGGGAGIGIFASVPGARSFGNVVIDNFLYENGLPGIAMHAHVPGQNLNDNMLVANTLIANGPDQGDAATSASTGINLYAAGSIAGTIIAANSVNNESIDIAVKSASPVDIHLNSLLGGQKGVQNLGAGLLYATANWWGCDGAPGASGCSTSSGPAIDSSAWLTTPIPTPPAF